MKQYIISFFINRKKKTTLSIFLLIFLPLFLDAQFLHVDGKILKDAAGDPVILRGIGLGGWMLQEGYMLQTFGPQHEIESRIRSLVGEELTEEFYRSWLANHCTKTDIDSMASWGYNSIRLPMHYKLFTPPIEEEPVPGEITWNEKGFQMVDSLLSWVNENGMYLILDMHAAPGGQGENADISDYDNSKPSLWESQLNKEKLIALWRKLAQRYANDPGIGAFDLLNETNWGFQNHDDDPNGCSESQNIALWQMQKDITEAIREVDQNHIVIIEGNCWGNNYNGLPQIWDDNLVISYHKYWNSNAKSSIQGMLDMREQRGVPIWLGETGENSNSWFTDVIKLLETNDVGWSMWPLKKMGGNNPLQIEITEGYRKILDYWSGLTVKPSPSEAYDALMELSENLKLENNTFHPDVVDAMIRQPYSDETLPFKEHVITDSLSIVYAADYDLGSVNNAYYDNEFTNETGNAGGLAWNQGYSYRNDGVDIETCIDSLTNGYNVGWTSDGEWMKYTLQVDSTAAYDLIIRYAALNNGSSLRILLDESDRTGKIQLPATGGYTVWKDVVVNNVVLNRGMSTLKVFIEKGGFNINYFGTELKYKSDEIEFKVISGITNNSDDGFYLNFNKYVDKSTIDISDFTCLVDGEEVAILLMNGGLNPSQLFVKVDAQLTSENSIVINYAGNELQAEDMSLLSTFENLEIQNNIPSYHPLPGIIQAEEFSVNEGLELENTTDNGGGENIGYTNEGDFLEYLINVPEEGYYFVDLRIACESRAGILELQQLEKDGTILQSKQVVIPVTGGWQTWKTITSTMYLNQGRTILKLLIVQPEFNLNWFRFSWLGLINGIEESDHTDILLYPNPATNSVSIKWESNHDFKNCYLTVSELATGKVVVRKRILPDDPINVQYIDPGVYLFEIKTDDNVIRKKLVLE